MTTTTPEAHTSKRGINGFQTSSIQNSQIETVKNTTPQENEKYFFKLRTRKIARDNKLYAT
jgi:hypothetical protein